ncbi:hypothetical protein RJ641_034210 [Dillenia turbinata]|uniref:Uncharacterized protein n=1 Tax=Dillenia turbinata TaxID=194707 RepID=A0AAN8VN58_9MAGN
MQGALKNDLIGIEFDPKRAGDPILKGEDVLQNRLGVLVDHSKWWDLAAFIKRAAPMFPTLYTMTRLKHLNKSGFP